MEKLSSTLKQLLNTANISEAELARRTGIAQPMVNRLATGKNKNPKLETLKPIAKYFSVTFSQLLGEEDLPASQQNNNMNTIINNNTAYQLPVFNWNELNLNTLGSEKMVATTAKVSARAFALVVEGDELEPRFPNNSLLTIDPELNYNSSDFVLVKTTSSQNVKLMQIEKTENNLVLKELRGNKESVEFNVEQHTIVGVLVQAKHDYK